MKNTIFEVTMSPQQTQLQRWGYKAETALNIYKSVSNFKLKTNFVMSCHDFIIFLTDTPAA